MTCRECEIKLGMGEDAAAHLASCEECRSLAEELRLNALALSDMRVRTRVPWEWALAAAAAVVMGVGLWMSGAKKPPAVAGNIVVVSKENEERRLKPTPQAKARATRVRTVRRKEPVQALKVKMFTSDPDVVIYWIVDRKETFE
jgi:hypothetical protein